MSGEHPARITSSVMGSMVWFIGLVVFLFLQVAPVNAAAAPKRILALYWYNKDFPSNPAFDRSFQAAVKSAPAGSIEYYSEYLESDRFPGENQSEVLRDYLHQKYANRSIDVVVAVSDVPLEFLLKYRESLFPRTPIVFVAIKPPITNEPSGPGLTGIVLAGGYRKTLDLALRLHPGTKQVFIISGTLNHDKTYETLCREEFQGLDSGISVNYFTDLSLDELIFKTKRLPERSLVLYIWQQLQDEGQLLESADILAAIAPSTTAPIYGVADWQVGRGVVGGYLRTFETEGTRAGEIALRIANGARAQDIPIESAPKVPIFDWRELHRWGIKETSLPPSSLVLNREPTVWELYKVYIIGGIALILAETLLIFGLLWQRRRRREVETELVISNDRLRLSVEAGRSVGWDWDIKSGRDQWFGDLETVFGMPSDKYSGNIEDFRSRVHPEDRELVKRAAADAQQNRKPYAAEFRVLRTDGTVRWITARGEFRYAQNGDAERMLGMAVDVTERKLSEEALRGSEQRLHLAIQAGKMYAYEWDASTDAIVRSAEFAEVLGTDQPRETSRRELSVQVHPDDRELLAAEFDRLTPENTASQVQYRLLHHDGALQWLERRARAMFDENGKLQRIIGVVVDISDRKQAEHKLRESEERFRLVANTAPVMIWMAGTDKLCNYFNQPWLDFTGRTIEAELGNGWAEMVHPEDFQACMDTYQRAFDRHETFQMEYRLRRHDGEYRWLVDIGVPRLNPDSSFAGYIGSCIDVTDRKLAGEALASVGRRLIEAHEEERTWIGRELHDDINQRLALLAVELDQWRRESSRDMHLLDHFRHAQQRISEIAMDVQALSHRLHSSKLDYLGLAVAAKSFCRELSEKAKVEIDFRDEEVPSPLPKEISLCLFRVMQEALQNAVKYSGVRTFKVDLRGTLDSLELTVADSGRGFEERDALSRQGLGLISMRERLQIVHGEFKVQSKPGSGTTIYARVPFETREYRAMAS